MRTNEEYEAYRDKLAAEYDVARVQFPSTEAMYAFVGLPFNSGFLEHLEAAFKAEAKLRYMYADAMMEARDSKPEKEPANKADAEGWMPYDGQGMPCDENQEVNIRLRDGTEDTKPTCAELWDWDVYDSDTDIVAWRLAK